MNKRVFNICMFSTYVLSAKNIFRLLFQPMTVNTQQEGEIKQERLGAVSLENDDSPHDGSGIDLEKSTLKLVKQDKLDKKEFRERIKQKHREKRMKNKVKRKRYEVCHKVIVVYTKCK